ncbi:MULTISPECIES: CHAT domain-containing protein [Spirulina sp. CCY15215]|uniref:CHAT domain-containing protein n=1 Tax=Spirulina sp. CCY15215 TaxID=2767591 RepID=UPI00194E884A|nr:CHAT domain-containing protein [Spirulina major]
MNIFNAWFFRKPHRRQGFFLLPFLLSLLFFLTFSSLAPSVSQAKPSRVDTLLDRGEISEAIAMVETGWKKDYQNFYRHKYEQPIQQTEAIAQKLLDIARETGENPAVIWAFSRPEDLVILLITPGNEPISFTIAEADSEELDIMATTFRREVANPRRVNGFAYRRASQQLYQWLIAPIKPILESQQIDTLLFCVGENLRSLPFAALHDGEQFLIEKYSLATIPAFSLTETTYTDIRNARVLAMGASEFQEQIPLPGVEVELSAIVPELWPGSAFLNQNFTIANLQAERQQDPVQIIHLATHAEFKSGAPDRSYIQFSDRQLSLDRLEELGWKDPPVELLVLSACQTALGDRDAELGFAGLAVQAGVKTAIASLWSVSDIGTLALMSEFYQQLRTAPIKTEALRQAQLAMIRGDIRLEGATLVNSGGAIELPSDLPFARVNLAHPYYWSAFVAIGSPW